MDTAQGGYKPRVCWWFYSLLKVQMRELWAAAVSAVDAGVGAHAAAVMLTLVIMLGKKFITTGGHWQNARRIQAAWVQVVLFFGESAMGNCELLL